MGRPRVPSASPPVDTSRFFAAMWSPASHFAAKNGGSLSDLLNLAAFWSPQDQFAAKNGKRSCHPGFFAAIGSTWSQNAAKN